MSYPIAKGHPAVFRFLGLPIHDVDVSQVHAYIEQVIQKGEKALILNYNVHAVNLAQRNSWLKDFFGQAQIVFCDGDGVRWGIRWMGMKPPPKITYGVWVGELAAFCLEKGISLYFLGAKPGVAEAAANKLKERFQGLRISGTRQGYFDKKGVENEQVISEINRLRPDILIVGFGMPAQEQWLQDNWQKLDCHIFLTGGAVFDYTSGNLKRAPQWMIRFHLEWLFRFLQEPGRLFIRYMVGNPLFLSRVFCERLRRK